MLLKCVLALAVTALLCFPSQVFAKPSGGKGVFCAQGGENIYLPASSFPANVRAKMVKGQKVKVNIAGFGPVNCVVY